MALAVGAAVIAAMIYVRARPRVTKIMLVSGSASSRRYSMAFIGYSGRRPYIMHTQPLTRGCYDQYRNTILEINLP